MASVVSQLVIEATAKVDDAQSNLRSLGDTLSLVGTAAGIVATAMVGVGAALVGAAQAADEQQRQIQRLGFALETMGLSADETGARLEDMFTSLSRISGISDEELREATAQFATFASAVGASAVEVERASVLIVDIAAQTGKSAARISRQVANVFAGNVEALAAISPALRAASEEIATVENAAERGRLAMELLSEQFGGAAVAAAGAGVNMRVLSNELGDLQQSIGDQVLASGEFQDALESVLTTLRSVDAQVRQTDSNLGQTLQNAGMLFNGLAAAVGYTVDVTSAWYNSLVDVAELGFDVVIGQLATGFDVLTTPLRAVYVLFTDGLPAAIDTITDGFGRVGQRIDAVFNSVGRAVESFAGLQAAIFGLDYAPDTVNELGQTVSSLDTTVRDNGETWQWLGDQIETALAVGQRMIPDVERQAAALFGSLRDFAFEGGEAPTARAGGGPSGPSASDEAAKVKETATILQSARDAAAAVEIEAAQAKEQTLIEIYKEAAEQRADLERAAAEQRAETAIELANKVRDIEIAAAREAAAVAEQSAQRRAAVASQAATVIIGSLDAIASGEEMSGRERRKALGTTLAAAGRGYLLQAIPEAFLNPARAAALAVGGASLVTFGASLGGRVFGGGGGGSASAGGAGFGSQGTGLSSPVAETVREPRVQNDLRGVTIITNDPDTMRSIVERSDEARANGLGGVL